MGCGASAAIAPATTAGGTKTSLVPRPPKAAEGAPPPPPPVPQVVAPGSAKKGPNALETFSKADVDDSGMVTIEELRTALMANAEMSESDCDMLFKICDKDKDGELSMMEFSRGIKKWATGYRLGDKNRPPPPPAVAGRAAVKKESNALETFRDADTDDSGTLTLEELKTALMASDELSEVQCEELFTICDKDKDGGLTMLEFSSGLKKWQRKQAEVNHL
jgi:Ca2+-binding EF-hand superfamily protein